MVKFAPLIPLFPFLAFCVIIAFGKKLKGQSAILSIAASGLAFLFSIMVFFGVGKGEGSYSLGTWLTVAGKPLTFGITVDGLSSMMLLVVTIVGVMIQVYSIGYMHDDPRYSRYFAYVSLFMASMLGLVLADNFVMLYLFWEGVGLCSYLLIAFWFEKPAAAKAGLKAFITTRIGDTGFLIGILILIFGFQVFSFQDLSRLSAGGTLLTVAAVLIFLGAVGKSAQFPLHVWLPDAMEGPTAVSALIHAATMVAAGVYLVARSFALFTLQPASLEIIAVVGCISAVMAASIALVNNDIKRVLAYSTISQLGFMMLGLGVGGREAGMFHLMTHAFFKALLFLCAGSVIHAVHTQDIQKMGGLFSKMKVTSITFILGALAISGVPPFSGFWSKDEILTAVKHSGHPVLFYLALLTSLFTAFYMARLIFCVLFGNSENGKTAHESPKTMTVPLMILAGLAVVAGLPGSPLMGHAFQNFIAVDPHAHAEIQMDSAVITYSIAASVLGIGLAYVMYIQKNKILPAAVRSKFSFLYKLLANKYYIDEIYEFIFVKPFLAVCRFSSTFDFFVVDGLVNGVAAVIQGAGGVLRRLQTGLIQNYLLAQVAGAIIFILMVIEKLCFRC